MIKLERKNNIDPNQFYDFYESKNWFVGKNKMKDWQAAIRTWERNTKGKIEIESNNPYPSATQSSKLVKQWGKEAQEAKENPADLTNIRNLANKIRRGENGNEERNSA